MPGGLIRADYNEFERGIYFSDFMIAEKTEDHLYPQILEI